MRSSQFTPEYGTLFVLVTPATCELFVADRSVVKQVLARRNDFLKPHKVLERMNVFGKNLASVEGADWQRHRKLTARAFHEKMHETWTNTGSVRTTRADMMRLSLGVLFKVCLNNGGSNNNITGTLTGNIAACHWHLSVVLGAISRSVTTAQRSNEEDVITSTKALGALLTELVETRRASPNNNLQGDLLSPILAPADHRGLSDDEAMGNSFLFMFAGHETTANPLIYIIHLLAIFPAWQDWAAAEIDQIICLSENGEVPQYGTSFPHLKRLRVILYETLRLYGPVPTIMRMTSGHDQTITLSDKVVVIPSNTPVQLNAMALHTNPQQWGPDPLAWKPDRGISKASNESSEEHISKDLSSCLLAWADGPRVCPGQKFSQIEVFAVLLRLLKNHRVELVPRPGQTMDHARSYAYNLIQNSVLTLTLQMPMAESLGLRWVER